MCSKSSIQITQGAKDETVTTKSRLNALLSEVMYGARVFQKNWNWFVSYANQTESFFDGMILLKQSNRLEVA